jgi:hypothetical protein
MRKPLWLIAAFALSALLLMASAAWAVVAPGVYDNATFNYAQAPTGTHLAGGATEAGVTCTVSASGNVTCPTTQFELAGVGNTNASALIVANYTATVDCRNHGGNVVESHTQTVPFNAGPTTLRAKNGRLTVISITATAPTNAQFERQATCPNPNWTAEVRAGTTSTLSDFTYTVTFAGFSGAFITISAP